MMALTPQVSSTLLASTTATHSVLTVDGMCRQCSLEKSSDKAQLHTGSNWYVPSCVAAYAMELSVAVCAELGGCMLSDGVC